MKKIGYLNLLLLTACGDGYFTEVKTVLSPSGKLAATQYHFGASAIGADVWEIRISDSLSKPRPGELAGCIAWSSGFVGVQTIVWESESKLQLGVPDIPRAHDYESTFKNKGCAGVSVTWHYEPYVERQKAQ